MVMQFTSEGPAPHGGQPVFTAGPALDAAAGALILVHGRGADAPGMLALGRMVAGPGLACLAPQAAEHSWYPYRFTEPTARNEPELSSALAGLQALLDQVLAAGIPARRVALLGFSQGACLALEFLRRHAQPLGAVIGFSGGLIGDRLPPPPGAAVLRDTPVLMACSERDAHIPLARLRETETLLRAMGADVTLRLRPGADHGVPQADAERARQLLAGMMATA
jgi:predicted esterase